jgi:5,5'-dehydrodivanillate O-demethylase
MKRRTTPPKKPGDKAHIDQHPLLFPNTLRHVFRPDAGKGVWHNLQYRVPVDDNRTQVFVVYFQPDDAVHSPADGDAPFQPLPLRDEKGDYRLDHVLVQDAMAWESQGTIADRSQETLGASDRGVAMYRRLVRDQIQVVQKSGDPLGVLRGAAAGVIELDVINERIGVTRPERQAVA